MSDNQGKTPDFSSLTENLTQQQVSFFYTSYFTHTIYGCPLKRMKEKMKTNI